VSKIMLSSWSTLIKSRPIGRWCWGLVLLLALPGCAAWNVRGEGFRDKDSAQTFQKLRPAEPGGEAFGFSNKAKQIERELGYQ
jgi:hypothetical protein